MDDNIVIAEAISLIDSMLLEIGDDYEGISKVMFFKQQLSKYKKEFENLQYYDNHDDMIRLLKVFKDEVQAFNIWMKVQSVLSALEKKGF